MYPNTSSYFLTVGRVDKQNLINGYILQPDAGRDFADAYAGNYSGIYDGP